MKKIIRNIRHLTITVTALLLAQSLTSCHKKLGPTAIQVEDSIRHYPSIILGDELNMSFDVRNVGNEILVITDIQPSCQCIESSKANVTTIPPGDMVTLNFTFHSDKNIGLARHSIRLFGNIAPKGVAELIFDTHVVRPSIDLSDYEEYYQKSRRLSTEQFLQDISKDTPYTTDQ